jgi:hypothetical protein
MWYVETRPQTPKGDARIAPVLDMLGLRYLVFRGSPLPGTRPVFQSPDYWVLANPSALPRAFVPRRIELVQDDSVRLEKLGSSEFNPRQVAYVETPVMLPDDCRGSAELVSETPTHLTLSVQMETAGLVVLTDRWDQGWRAWLNGRPVPILRTNHVLRGVPVPAGFGTLEFRYQPESFRLGLQLAGLGGFILCAWAGFAVFTTWRRRECSK